MESQVCVVEEANKNANILHCVWLDGMLAKDTGNGRYERITIIEAAI
jgi:hypothetical protein